MIEIEAGSIVESLKGRDAGRRFVVLRTDGEYAHITDGQTRKIDKPKLKKLKHLKELGIRKDTRVYEKIINGKSITDAEIRKVINLFSSEEVQ